jgi:hypothetical protein
MNTIFANVIKLLHIILILLMIAIPFSSDKQVLSLYVFFSLFIILHWILNEDACALTAMEQYLRGVNKTESFIGNLVGPVFKLNSDSVNQYVILIHYALVNFVLYKLTKDHLFR